MWEVLVVLAIVVILVVVVVVKGVVVVSQAQAIVIERLGSYNRTLHSGINIILPGIEKKKEVTWTQTRETPSETLTTTTARPDGTPQVEAVIVTKHTETKTTVIDLRKNVYDFPAQGVITKDNVVLNINGLLYYQITDPARAVYEIADLTNAIEKLTQTTLRNVVGGMDLDETLAARDAINTKLKSILDEVSDKWGVKVNRVELQAISPPPKIQDAMAEQMKAERERRAVVIKAQGAKEADIAEAEGKQRAKILIAEGEAEARIKIAHAEAQAITKITEASAPSSCDPGNYLIALRYIETLKEMVSGKENKVIYIPYEATGVLSAIGGIRDMLEGTGGKRE